MYLGYITFFAPGDSSLILEGDAKEGQLLATEFLVRLDELQSINFSRDLFNDPRFRSLVSFSTAPEIVPAGRPNPFSR